jgi:hypothetical protein
MTKRKRIETSEDLVHILADLFNEVSPETSEEIDDELRKAGYDPDEVAERMKSVAERAIANSPFNWRNQEQELAGERARLEHSTLPPGKNRMQLIEAIKQLLAQLGGNAKLIQAYYRNFEEMSDEDLASLQSELEFLISQQRDANKETGE